MPNVKKGPPLALAFRAVVGGVKLAYEYLGLTLIHSLLWFAFHFPLLLGLWSIWADLSATLPEKGRFAYFSREEGRCVLILANQDGKGSLRLPLEGLKEPEDPCLSPDGKEVVFVDGGRLYLLEVESGRRRALREAGRVAHPSFSPDGRRIVFALESGEAPADLYLMDLGSGAEERLTKTPVPESDPSFSPDGKRVAFVRPDEDGNQEIWAMELADGRTREIQITRTAPPAANLRPAFSPDGTRLAFLARRGGRTEIHLAAADGRGETPLTRNRLEEESPVFSSSGSKVFFLVRGAEGEAVPYFAGTNGGGERRLGAPAEAQPFPWSFLFLVLLVTGALLAAPANAAMVFVSLRSAEDEPRLRDFFLGFKRHYLRSAAVYSAFVLLGALLLLNIVFALRMRLWIGMVSAILSAYVLLFLLLVSIHFSPLIVLQPNTFRKVWKKGFLLALDNGLATAAFGVITLGLAALAGFTGILLVLFYPAAVGHAARLFFQGLLAQYEDPVPAEGEAGAAGRGGS